MSEQFLFSTYTHEVSSIVEILGSVIQGSAIGPVSYVVNASDLRTVNPGNQLFKFADDTYLLIPSINSFTCESEIQHVKEWALSNNLGLNQSKSMEMVITAPGTSGAHARAHLDYIWTDIPGIDLGLFYHCHFLFLLTLYSVWE